jgi:hypothetical protein
MSHAEQAAEAIVALINSRPTTPRLDEIVAIIARVGSNPVTLPRLSAEIRAKIAELRAAYDVVAKLHPGPDFDAAEARVDLLADELNDLEEQIPNPPRSLADIVMRADVAMYWT